MSMCDNEDQLEVTSVLIVVIHTHNMTMHGTHTHIYTPGQHIINTHSRHIGCVGSTGMRGYFVYTIQSY